MPDDTLWLRLSLLQHFAYCPHQARLVHEGVWSDNHLTAEGTLGHQRVDTHVTDHRRGVRVHHRVQLTSHRLRVYGVADAIEEDPQGALMPVEHKHGRGRGDLRPSILHVVAQALCLEEATCAPVDRAAVYLSTERRRVEVVVDHHRSEVELLVRDTRTTLTAGSMPGPPQYSPSLCRSCSIQLACQPIGGDLG